MKKLLKVLTRKLWNEELSLQKHILSTKQKTLEDAVFAIKELEKQREFLEKELTNIEGENESLSSELRNARENIAELESANRTLNRKVTELQDHNTKHLKVISQKKKENESLTHQLKRINQISNEIIT